MDDIAEIPSTTAGSAADASKGAGGSVDAAQPSYQGYGTSTTHPYYYPHYYYPPYGYHAAYGIPPQTCASPVPTNTATSHPTEAHMPTSTQSLGVETRNGVPTQKPSEAAPSRVPTDAPVGMQQQQALPYQDPNRMHLMAKSVSITVNQLGQGPKNGSVEAPGTAVLTTVPPGETNTASSMNTKAAVGTSTAAAQQASTSSRLIEEAALEQQMVAQARRWLRRSCLLRSFRAWRHLCERRWWKVQLEMRDGELAALACKCRHIENRPVRYMRRYRLRCCVWAWQGWLAQRREERAMLHQAVLRRRREFVGSVLLKWHDTARKERIKAIAQRRMIYRHERHLRRTVFDVWVSFVFRRQRQQELLKEAIRMRNVVFMKHVLGCWAYLARLYGTERAAVAKHRQRALSRAADAWRMSILLRKEQNVILARFQARHIASLRQWAFFAWMAFAEGRHLQAQAQAVQALQSEVEQLRRDNERLAKVIDSGDWGRERITELTQAAQILQQERDALVKLVESLPGSKLRRQSGAWTAAGSARNEGAVALSQRNGDAAASRRGSLQLTGLSTDRRKSSLAICNAGVPANVANSALPSAPSQTTSATCHATSTRAPQEEQHQENNRGLQTTTAAAMNAATRNKMTVRAGSSFNALVRALKQDLLATGALERDPIAVFAVDKASTQRVEIMNDGGVRVQVLSDTAGIPGQSFPRAGSMPGSSQSSNEERRGRHPAAFGGRSVAFGKRIVEEKN
jgi:hypothetical protein